MSQVKSLVAKGIPVITHMLVDPTLKYCDGGSAYEGTYGHYIVTNVSGKGGWGEGGSFVFGEAQTFAAPSGTGSAPSQSKACSAAVTVVARPVACPSYSRTLRAHVANHHSHHTHTEPPPLPQGFVQSDVVPDAAHCVISNDPARYQNTHYDALSFVAVWNSPNGPYRYFVL